MNKPANPEEATRVIAAFLIDARMLTKFLEDENYWIEKAKEEAGFIPGDKPWIHVSVEIWRIEVSVHNGQQTKVWINGQWFDTHFPEKTPYLSDLLKE